MFQRGAILLTSEEQCKAYARSRSVFATWLPRLAPLHVKLGSSAGANTTEVPTAIFLLRLQLQSFTWTDSSLLVLPENFCQLQALRKLQISRGQLQEIPASFGALSALEDLDLSHNKLEVIPSSIGELVQLRYLNLMGNKLVLLPDSIGNLKSLYRLGLKDNVLVSLPDSLGGLTGLVELFVTGNSLATLPDSIGELCSLVKLQASFNRLQSMPNSMSCLQKLELMRVAINDIHQVPNLSNMHGLAWLSIAGTPACAPAHVPLDVPVLTMDQLDVGPALGDGASGDVFEGYMQGKPVAVKVFKADVSPDGHAQDEIAVASCLDHPNLIRVRGRILQPPALVVDRIAGKPLAAKPNHTSLLRCRWAAGTTFAPDRAVHILLCVARALEHLHSLNIAHGDCYAHNIIADDAGHAVLYDYGASFFYHPGSSVYMAQEVRAYGLLLMDMAARLDRADGQSSHTQTVLDALVDACVHAASKDRPSFADIALRLRHLHDHDAL